MTERQESGADAEAHMTNLSAMPQRDLDVVVAVRLAQLVVMLDDVALTSDLECRRRKLEVVDDLLMTTRALAIEPPLPQRFAPFDSPHPGPDLDGALRSHAAAISARLSRRSGFEALVEFVASTDWPRKLTWVDGRDAALTSGAVLLLPGISPEDVPLVSRTYRRAVKRLKADSASPAVQVGWGLFAVASTAAAPGLASGAGTLIGSHFLGLSGAAATSAGLALLGGGSIAAGGFGMAGGALLVHGVTTIAKAGGTSLITKLASTSPSAIVDELAKLDAAVGLEPLRRSSVIDDLSSLEVHLKAQLETLKAMGGSWRWSDAADHAVEAIRRPTSMVSSARRARNDLVPENQRNLAASCRAVEYEIRYLESSDWKRNAMKGARILKAPYLSKIVDRI